MTVNWRLFAAFVVSPVIPCFLYNIPDYFAFHTWSNSFLLQAVAVAEALVLLVAVPTFLLLRRRFRITLTVCLIAGFLICFAASCLLAFLPLNPGYSAGDGGGSTVINGHITAHGVVSQLIGASIFGLMGTITALIFWVVGIRNSDSLHESV